MKTDKVFYALLMVALSCVFLTSCAPDEEESDENEVNHVGEKWNITSVEYIIIDQNLTNPGQGLKMGTATDAGAFYFDGSGGSFDITAAGYHLEDVYSS